MSSAGSGLLAFMAASAGSPKVFACEQNELIASAAETTASSLGLENTVKIFRKKSQSLSYPDEVDSEVDVFVTETMGNDLLGELMKDLIQVTKIAKAGFFTLLLKDTFPSSCLGRGRTSRRWSQGIDFFFFLSLFVCLCLCVRVRRMPIHALARTHP